MKGFYYYMGYPLGYVYPGDPLALMSPDDLAIVDGLLGDLRALDDALSSVVLDSVATVVGKMTLDPLRAEYMMRDRARSIVQQLARMTSVEVNADIYATGRPVQWRVPG